MHRRIVLTGSFSTILLLSGILTAQAQGVPVLNLDPTCRGIAQGAAGAGERGGPGLSPAVLGASARPDKASLGRGPATPQEIANVA